jgi:phosphate:Na+ symporter
MFQTLFNIIGVIIFWPLQHKIEQWLLYFLPDPVEPKVLITDINAPVTPEEVQEPVTSHSRYLNDAALASADIASNAVVQELQYLGRLSLEVICHALYQPTEQLNAETFNEELLDAIPDDSKSLNAGDLYQRHIKGVYSDLLGFMSRLSVELDEDHQKFWMTCHVVALQLVDAVKNAKHLQKNLYRFLRHDDSFTRAFYLDLRRHVVWVLSKSYEISRVDLTDEQSLQKLNEINIQNEKFTHDFRHRLFTAIRDQQLNNRQASSLMNDLNYSNRIAQSFNHVLQVSLTDDNELLRELRHLGGEKDVPLVNLF